MTSPYIDTFTKIIKLRFPLKSLYGLGVLLAVIAYLCWGRGGLPGEGSGVVGVVGELVLWGDPRSLDGVGSVGGVDSWGGGPMVDEPGKSPDVS